MFRLAHPEYLYLLLFIPLAIILFWRAQRRKRKSLKKFGELSLIMKLIPQYSRPRIIIKFILWMLAWTFLVVAIADPQTGSKLEKIKRKGVDMVFALDVSNSMAAQDVSPNRLERAKQAITHLLGKLENDRVGLVVFAGKAYIQMPVTTDYSAAQLFLADVNMGSVPVQGTAIGDAIETAMNCFGSQKQGRAIIIITDGENHEDNAVEAAKKAAAKGIRVYTIGIGSEEGAPIPLHNGSAIIGYKKDFSGKTVISKLNEVMLKDIATEGKGIFVRANNSQSGVNEVYNQIDKLEKEEYNTAFFSDYDDRFQIFLFIAFLLLLIEIIIPNKKGNLFRKLHLFKDKNEKNEI